MKKITGLIAILACCTMPHDASAVNNSSNQNENAGLTGEVSGSWIVTELEKKALALSAKVMPVLNAKRFIASENGVGYLGPTVKVDTGDADSFESILAKVSGFYMPTPSVDCDGEPDYFKSLNVFPFSIGLETDKKFDSPAVLAEFGWTPIGKKVSDFERFGLDATRGFGVFAQLGYKFDNGGSTIEDNAQGGDTDQSDESRDESIARIKAELAYGFELAGLCVVTPKMTGWYDMKNGATYHQIEALIRISLVKDKYFFDMKYDKGSGAPNFNEGDQFAAGLTIAY